MDIVYTDERRFTKEQLKELFESVGWFSANYPDKLYRALNSCETVFTAWAGDELAGLINAIDDGALTAYVHYLLVNPKYQKSGIGRKLTAMLKEKYKDYLCIALSAENPSLVDYYGSMGFEAAEGASYMRILNK